MVVVRTDVVVFTPGTSASMYVVCKCGTLTTTTSEVVGTPLIVDTVCVVTVNVWIIYALVVVVCIAGFPITITSAACVVPS
jgi:hypothetical protein